MKNCSSIDYLRAPKIFGIAIFDLSITLLALFFIAKITHRYFSSKIDLFAYIIIVELLGLLLGIIVHKIFGIDTMLGYYLGLNKIPIRKKC